jgi:hypothetical protein
MNLATQQLAQNKSGATHCKHIALHDHEYPRLNYFQRMVRNGFFIGKRILSAFLRYARLSSYEHAVEKDSYAFADRPEFCRRVRSIDFAVVGLWRMAYCVWFISSNYML